MKTFFLSLVLFLTLLPAVVFGQDAKRFRAFVPADSVAFFDARRENYLLDAKRIDTAFEAQPLVLEDRSQRARKKALRAWKTDVAPRLNLAGGAGDEFSDGQTYAAAENLRSAAALFLLTGEAGYIDVVESALTNALAAAILPEAPFFEQRVAAKAVIDATEMIYATDEEGIYVNLFVNSFVRFGTPRFHFTLDQITSQPHGDRVRLRLADLPRGGSQFTLRLRLPGWIYGRFPEGRGYRAQGDTLPVPPIYVNGREALYTLKNGYVEITRTWTNRDEIYFDLPLSPRFVTREGENGSLLLRGPLLYVAPEGSGEDSGADFTQQPDAMEFDARGRFLLRYPARDGSGKQVDFRPYQAVAPDRRGDFRLWMKGVGN